jgi:hypothetical protein
VLLLLSSCGEKAGLDAGRHTVEMRASLPGTDVVVTSKVEVELRCPKLPLGLTPQAE